MDKLDNLILTDTSDDDYTLLMSHVVCGEPELLFWMHSSPTLFVRSANSGTPPICHLPGRRAASKTKDVQPEIVGRTSFFVAC